MTHVNESCSGRPRRPYLEVKLLRVPISSFGRQKSAHLRIAAHTKQLSQLGCKGLNNKCRHSNTCYPLVVVVIAIVMPGSTAVKGVWQVKEGLALDYLIIPSLNSGVEHLWVDWKQSFLLLEELTPNFSKIWTLNGISYCPLLDILQAAVKSNGLARELLDSLVQPLFEGEHFEEVELENEEGGLWQACRSQREDEEQRTTIDEPQNQDEAHLEGIAGEKRRQSDQKFKVRDVSSLFSCGICLYRAPGRVRLYSHYVTKHPDSPCLHPPRPPGTLHTCPACGELFSSRSLLRRHQHSAHQSLGLSSEREEHIKSGESNTCLSCGRTFATRIWLYKHCAADHPENEDIRPERPFKVKGLRLAHLHERKNLECGLPGCDLTFTHFKVESITFLQMLWIRAA